MDILSRIQRLQDKAHESAYLEGKFWETVCKDLLRLWLYLSSFLSVSLCFLFLVFPVLPSVYIFVYAHVCGCGPTFLTLLVPSSASLAHLPAIGPSLFPVCSPASHSSASHYIDQSHSFVLCQFVCVSSVCPVFPCS